MKLSSKEKLAIQRENLGIKKQLEAGGLKAKDKTPLQRLWKENLKRLEVKAQGQTEGGMIDKYVSGGFNSVDIMKFLEVIDQVSAEGADLDQLKTGAKSWAEANEPLLS
jgi:hypothetical protein